MGDRDYYIYIPAVCVGSIPSDSMHNASNRHWCGQRGSHLLLLTRKLERHSGSNHSMCDDTTAVAVSPPL